MRRILTGLVLFVALGLAPRAVHADVQTGLVGYWPMNEGTGTTTADMSGNGHNGTLNKGATWISPGFLGSAAVNIDGNPGSRVSLGTWDPGDQVTLAIWAKWTGEQNKAPRAGLIGKRNNWTADGIRWFVEVMTTGEIRMRNFTQTVSSPAGTLTAKIDEWAHITVTCDGARARIYLDAQQVASGNFTPGPMRTAGLGLGCKEGGSNSNTEIFSGSLDEARIYNGVLSALEVRELFEWTDLPGKAQSPSPADGRIDVARDVVLSWTPGEFTPASNGHRVYFSASLEDIINGVGAVAQDANTYVPPQPLDYGKTYYWRVDEVNETSDKPLFKGPVWSFTVEQYAYPVKPVAATASSAQSGMDAEKTIDSSGLTGDQHSIDQTAMWLNDGTMPSWIRYEFDDLYKLHEIRVWNYNQLLEGVLGFGAKDVTVEYSLDDVTWTKLSDVTIPQANGTATYAGTTINLAGVLAKFIRLTIHSNWNPSGLILQTGLSEVRFSSVPVKARLPQPAAAATDVAVDTMLSWRAGREAVSHQVYFSTDSNVVTAGTVAAQTVGENRFDPGSLDLGTTYYWKVTEVNEAKTLSAWPGGLWSFTTREYFVIDDFESYNDEDESQGMRIYQTWLDGVVNGTTSTVGNWDPPFAERTIVHGGKQSMPLDYNNVNAPFYAEAEREFASPQDWTSNGADTLSLWVRGHPVAYVDDAGTVTMSAAGHDIWDAADDFRFASKTLTGNGSITVKVESLTNTHNWAKAGVMIRQNLDADSKFVYLIVSYSQGVSLGFRQMTGSTCSSVTQVGVAAPQWVKLTRTGDAFTAQYSADGKTWLDLKNADGTVASATVSMLGPVYVGLCVTSHNTAATTTGVFSGTTITGTVTGAWQVTTIGDDPQPSNSPGVFCVTVQDNAGKKATVTHATAVTTDAWTQWQIPLDSLTGINAAKVKKLIFGVDNRANPAQGGAGRVYLDDIGFGHPLAR